MLAGDLTDLGKPQEAELLAQDLKACSIPVVGVLGNHDYECGAAEEVSHILRDAGMKLLDGQATEIDGVGFVGVKGFAGGFGRRMLGSFGEPAIKQFVGETMNETMRLENAMRSVRSTRSVVILHYAPIVDTIESEPLEIYPFLGSSRLAETIDRFKVSAIVHGHAHRGRFEGRTPGGQRGLQRRAPDREAGRQALRDHRGLSVSIACRDRSDCRAGSPAPNPDPSGR